MKILGKAISRRALLQRLGVVAVLLPAVQLGKRVTDVERRRRRRKELEDLEDIWIGHC